MDKILEYDSKDASSNLAIPTKNQKYFNYAKRLRSCVKYLHSN
ncbi:hypothetical protein THALO_460090 [Tenacibaculum halocynthiae]